MSYKKIGIVCTSASWGGLEMNTLKLALWLQEYGWEVRLLLTEAGASFKKAPAYCDDVASIQDVAGADVRKVNRGIINKWLHEKNVSVLFTPYNKDIAALSNYKRWNNKVMKLVYQQHMKVGVKKKDLIHTLRYSMLDAWISPLAYLKEETLRYTRVKEERIHIIPFGLEIDTMARNSMDKAAARAMLQLPHDVPMIGVLGRIDPKKEQKFLIEAIDSLKKQHGVMYHLVIMGAVTANEGDAYLQSLHQLVADRGLQDKVHFKDYATDVVPFFKAIDVFALPSEGETFGMVTIEAMANECPVIGTDKDGTREILRMGKLGYLYNYNDLDSFCTQMILLKNNNHLKEMVQDARNEVLQQYTKQHMCEQMNVLLQQLI